MERPEYFIFGPYHFDVADLLRQIEAGTIAAERFLWPIVDYAERSLGLSRDHKERRTLMIGAFLDHDHLPQVSLERLEVPVLIARTHIGNMLIDGRHRVAKAYLSGIDVLPAILIEHNGGVPLPP